MMPAPDFSEWLDFPPYGLNSGEKSILLLGAMRELTKWHAQECFEYRRVLDALKIEPDKLERLEDVPYLPVRLFKDYELLSIPRNEVFKTMSSSGTTGQQVSRIYLDRHTASFQMKVLSRLMGEILGKKRLPMLIIDSPRVLMDRLDFSARSAGILGFSMFGQDVTYALDDSMNLNIDEVEAFIARHCNKPIFIFGFTFMIWQYFILPLRQKNKKINLENGILLHGGGWKKLQDISVNNETFKLSLMSIAQIKKVINYYGMVEQTGSIFMECEAGYLHAPIYADVIVRRPNGFQLSKFSEEGIIEVLSILPRSYPGHALITEDVGIILGEVDCTCGRLGKYFHIKGRLIKTEVRGCSDAYVA